MIELVGSHRREADINDVSLDRRRQHSHVRPIVEVAIVYRYCHCVSPIVAIKRAVSDERQCISIETSIDASAEVRSMLREGKRIATILARASKNLNQNKCEMKVIRLFIFIYISR